MAEELTLERRIELVRNSIERIRHFHAKHIEAQADPTCSSEDRDAARFHFNNAEQEFSWQWRNVEAILDALCPRLDKS